MIKYSKQDIMDMVSEEDVRFIRLQFTDIFGTLKNVAITTSQLEKALNNQCMFDGLAIEGYAGKRESDFYLYPDPDTFEIFPWRPQSGKVARMICDVYGSGGVPCEEDSRYILKRVLKEASDMGYRFDVGPECEFFLFHTDEDGRPTTVTHERAGYFDVAPLDLGENARRDIVLTLEDMDFEIEGSHHEVAPAQHEIDFKYDTALKTADNVMTLKMVVKSIAKRHGLYASFMPKPLTETAGSGMHLNMSLSREGKNVFADSEAEDGLSQECKYFIAGLLKHARAMSLFTNPLINSYKRLVPGFGAPIQANWGDSYRSPLIRIPSGRGEGTRVEFRSPDSASNPYLVMALCLAAGLDGIKKKLIPPAPIHVDYEMTDEQMKKEGLESLPGNLYEACQALEQDEFVKQVLGERVVNQYLEAKKKEWADYIRTVSDWEINEYLYRI